MNKETLNKVLGIIGGVAVLAVLLLVAYMPSRSGSNEMNGVLDPQANPETALDAQSNPNGYTGENKVGNGTTAVALSYEAALKKYADRRIQFGEDCLATPGVSTYKEGTEIMIDNRSKMAKTFNVISPVSVGAYGFAIVKLSSATLTKEIGIDCGTQQNAATVLIQK